MSFKTLFFSLIIFFTCIGSPSALSDTIPVPNFSPLSAKGVPAGWELDIKKGKPIITLVKIGDSNYLHLISNKSSFGIKKGFKVDIREYPYLNWEWAATKLPYGGDIRKRATDDQVLQIYVAFPATGLPEKFHSPVIGYIWDNEAPKNSTGRSPQICAGKLRYYVVKNKVDKLNQWHTEKRNIYADYKKLFPDINGGEPTGPTVGMEIFINSQHTGTQAEGFIGNIYFSKN